MRAFGYRSMTGELQRRLAGGMKLRTKVSKLPRRKSDRTPHCRRLHPASLTFNTHPPARSAPPHFPPTTRVRGSAGDQTPQEMPLNADSHSSEEHWKHRRSRQRDRDGSTDRRGQKARGRERRREQKANRRWYAGPASEGVEHRCEGEDGSQTEGGTAKRNRNAKGRMRGKRVVIGRQKRGIAE
jgi:hypothetical protein